jgi:hypothetical protein
MASSRPFARRLAPIALSLLTACATTPPPSPQPITQRPSECLRACPQLPQPTDGDELAVALWTFDLIDAAAECRRLHDACRAAAH